MSIERVVIADDLSGAAEIAGIAQRQGWRTQLSTNTGEFHDLDSDVQVWVIDTNSRDVPEFEAVQRNTLIGALLARRFPDVSVFKKIDSVLRGHVAAESEALARQLNFTEVLLLPANPSRSRCIRKGRYEIAGVPLSQTSFAHDPHYPARSDDVRALLHAPDVAACVFSTPDITTIEELKQILAQTRADSLIVGAADAFLATCPSTTSLPSERATCPRPSLILNGSAALQGATLSHLCDNGATVLDAHDGIDRILEALRTSGTVHATLGPHDDQKLRALTVALRNQPHLHLALTGGATARAICDHLQIDQFEVLEEWAPGVVRLRPFDVLNWEISIKPGSYTWPESFLHAVS